MEAHKPKSDIASLELVTRSRIETARLSAGTESTDFPIAVSSTGVSLALDTSDKHARSARC